MANIKKYNGSTWENTTARKYETKSEIIIPPTTIYADGTAATVSLKGNTIQNGTPTPSNPVDVQGVGTLDSGQYKIPISNGQQTTNIYLGSTQTTRQIKKLKLTGTENIIQISGNAPFAIYLSDIANTPDRTYTIWRCSHYQAVSTDEAWSSYSSLISRISTTAWQLCFRDTSIATLEDFKTFLVTQYANDTPVTIWYVLATPETGIVNEPLMKIGDYADTLSNATAIPTTEGANSITVDTTVQPSEFTATWTGWHDSSVKEWDGSQWN